MISPDTIAQELTQAEQKRIAVAGSVNSDTNQVRLGYQEIIKQLQPILGNADPQTDQEKLAIGQTIFTIATIYTSLAYHDTDQNKQKQEYLQKAKQLMEGKLMQICQPAMEKLNHSVHNTPLIWQAEINRVKARIEEKKPYATEDDLKKARNYYAQAVNSANQAFFDSIIRNNDLWSGALSVWSTALGEKSLTYSKQEQDQALIEMSNVVGTTYSLYTSGGHKDLDRTSTVLGRVINYCASNQIDEGHPTYQQTTMLFVLIARDMPKDILQKMLSKAEKENLKLPANLTRTLQTIIDRK